MRNRAAFTLSVAREHHRLPCRRHFADGVDKRLLTALFIPGSAILLIIPRTRCRHVGFHARLAHHRQHHMMQPLLVGEIWIVSFGSIFGLISLAGSGSGPIGVGILRPTGTPFHLP
jgi:hypothetical protein